MSKSIDALHRLAGDPVASRVQLWLRALEDEDFLAIQRLRRVDGTAEGRVRAFVARQEREAPARTRDNPQKFYGWLQDRHFEEYAELSSVRCTCPECAPGAAASAQAELGDWQAPEVEEEEEF